MELIKKVRKILEPLNGPLLLGLSGGVDSLVLLHLLVACKKKVHVAHVDHGWRTESSQEARELKKHVLGLGLPFHLHVIKKKETRNLEDRNLEDRGRKARLAFFSKIYKKEKCQALLLAHHADDQAETILKRVLEGSHFLFWGGMKMHATLEGMDVVRPLLTTPKKELKKWAEQKGLAYFQDPTNEDKRFLRGRMRTQILPLLAKSFGKEVAGNLLHLGHVVENVTQEAQQEVDRYLNSATQHVCKIPLTCSYLVRSMTLKRFFSEQGVFVSRAMLAEVCSLLQQGKKKKLKVNNNEIILDIETIKINK